MTDKQILRKAIEKAYENGWGKGVNSQKLNWTIAHDMNFMYYQYYYSIIFSHDFAKAFWCKHKLCTHHKPHMEVEHDMGEWCSLCDNEDFDICWQYHLQQMVLEKEPLKYLEQFLGG